jgi:hypothetical protein
METLLLQLILQNANAANIGDATGLRGSSTAGSFYISLHTSDPGEGGDQSTNETSYGAYARVAVTRSGGAWNVSGGAADNASAIVFPECTSGSATITHFGIGSASSGAGHLFFSGALSASLAVSAGITPAFAAGALDITVD